MGKRRIQIDITEEDYEIISQLKEKTYHSTISGIFNDAFKVYNWVRDEEACGKVLLSVPKENRIRHDVVREMVPVFVNSSKKGKSLREE